MARTNRPKATRHTHEGATAYHLTPEKELERSGHTHEGATAYHLTPEKELERSVMSCLLWEDTFYEQGEEIAERIAKLVPQAKADVVCDLAIRARNDMKLRHAPLWLAVAMAKSQTHKQYVATVLENVIQRPDELCEVLALYSRGRKTKPLAKLSKQIQKGIARAFPKFDAYQLAKYDRKAAITLRDALFVSHAKPKDEEQAEMWRKLIDGTLEAPDTWEVALSAGKDKKESWGRLISERKLGGLAMLRNLRNMDQAGVPEETIRDGLLNMNAKRVLPFRFIAAAKHAPRFEPELEDAMLKALSEASKLAGRTVLLVDHSGSMPGVKVSAKSEMDRFEAACALAILAREVCENIRIFAFSDWFAEVPPRRGFGLRDALMQAGVFWGTYLGQAIQKVAEITDYDRLIVITDEQSHDRVPPPLIGRKGYILNVAPYQNGVGYGAWTHIDGWSEAVMAYIQAVESTA